ncbi:MAG: DNA-directed RNA polymerase subunit K [Nanoarchaeota archaeon]
MDTKNTQYTKFEIARLIGARALQISMGAPFMLKLEDKDLEKISYSPIEIAKLEFSKNVLPLEIKRALPKEVLAAQQKVKVERLKMED